MVYRHVDTTVLHVHTVVDGTAAATAVVLVIGNAIYTTGAVSITYTTGGVCKRLYTPPALVPRTHLGRTRKQLEYVVMG